MELMTYAEFTKEVNERVEEYNKNYVNATDMFEDDYFNQAIRVDFSSEEETYILDAYGDYLKDEANSVTDVMKVLSRMDSEDPILTIENKDGRGRMEAGMDRNDDGEPFDYWDYTEMPAEALEKATITSVYRSDNLFDRWCVDAELDGETFTKCFEKDKERE